MTYFPNHRQSAASGFAMMEVLIAIVILLFGLLGFAGLQAAGIRYNHAAYLRTQAALQASDMVDRMRANPTAIAAGNYDNVTGTGTDPGCITSGCTPVDLAKYDQYAWNTANAAVLPSGQGTVAKSGKVFLVKVMWDAARNGATGTGCGTASTDLKCLQITVQP
jgi:type IV pilus assembly protein PilV